jgi:hypothetical protein
MKLARVFAVCVLLLALAAPTTAAARWIDFGTADPNAAPDVTLLRSGTSGVSLAVDVPGIEAADVATDLGLFTELRVPGSAFSIEIGSPMLPVIREYIEIPQGAIPRLSITRADYREVALSDLGIEHRIVPVQESAAKIAGGTGSLPTSPPLWARPGRSELTASSSSRSSPCSTTPRPGQFAT